ncbi:SDR family NAD(P)-dependent oxidoreductase [Streptomyces sp. NBC_01763]|uniref:SDR family NAD(P)-dependent oxidoreductase n=1 Tax=Streptomyces sp. NBC_01763 TaxID=2975934 RepID=UPI002DDA5E1E|nr:SDR family oxidoreductase [Streptomyces sp. NBC_01763]WSC40851.1 SDR family oxidoreductase [Streptomyces sp. NBC_01763]
MKVAIITGASSGIGRSAAIEIAKGGNGVILTYSTNPQGGLETAATIEKEGGTAVALPLDVSEAGTFVAFRDRVSDVLRETWQRDTFDYLVNNAGFAQTSLIEDTTEETFDRLMRVLLKGPYFLTQKLLPLMADGGAIVNTSSNSATAATGLEPGYSAYASMKGGLDVLTRYMAKEFSTRGIRVNSVCSSAPRRADGTASPTSNSQPSPTSGWNGQPDHESTHRPPQQLGRAMCADPSLPPGSVRVALRHAAWASELDDGHHGHRGFA